MSDLRFHEFKNAMSVMDGRRCIAVARLTPSHGWVMRVHDGCWTDIRARTQGLIPGKYPNLMRVRTRPQARTILSKLAATLGASHDNA